MPPDNPAKVTALGDLAKPGVKVAVCQPQVPCGKVAAEVFANAKLTVKPVTEEVDVKSVLTKVTLGEVDAGVVYVTDVQAAGDKVKGVEIPADVNASTSYPIATLEDSKHQKEAAEFVDLVLSDDGAKVLEEAGFAEPLMASSAGGSAPRGRWASPRSSARCCSSSRSLGLLRPRTVGGLGRILGTAEVLDALWLSLFSATAAMLISLVLGVPLAWVLARSTHAAACGCCGRW